MKKHSLIYRFVALFVVLALGTPTVYGAAPSRLNTGSPAAQVEKGENSGLYRTTISVRNANDWARLERLAIVVLDRQDDTATVLVDDEQLETLARLRFEPKTSDELSGLLRAQGPDKVWLQARLQPLVDQGVALQALLADKATTGEALQSTRSALRSAMSTLTAEQRAGVASSSSLDDDADGLTNTQEQWWCTNALNPDSDGDGATDGAEVQAAKDWLANRAPSYPSTGKPFAQWPPQIAGCVDDDQDSVPDLAERWDLGLNMNRESTDRDKFDDGQELFGLTYCPGSGGYCGYGALPRNEDWGVIFAEMPAWVKPPGRHPLVAAYPVPRIDVLANADGKTFRVETVTVVTAGTTIASGTTKLYSTSTTDGTSTSLSESENWNNWQEVSSTNYRYSTVADVPIDEPSSLTKRQGNAGENLSLLGPAKWGFLDTFEASADLTAQGAAQGAASGCVALGCISAAGNLNVNMNNKIDSLFGDFKFSLFTVNVGGPDQVQREASSNTHSNAQQVNGADPQDKRYLSESNLATQDWQAGGAGTRYEQPTSGANSGRLSVQHFYEMKYPTMRSSETASSGQSRGGSRTTTTEQYEEQTITSGEEFSSEEGWSNATAVDSGHAADLRFTYRVQNTGAEYAREIANLAFNLYIGDDPNPAYTYFVAPDIGGDGKFHNFMPGEEHTYTSHHIPLTLDQMKAIEVDPSCAIRRRRGWIPPWVAGNPGTHCPGSDVRIVVEDFTYGIDELFYEDAANAGVGLALEDGTNDGDEAIDTYLVPTWGNETVLDVLARYFPHTTGADGALIAIWTPEYRSDTPAWCVDPRIVGTGSQRTLWCKHALSTADWWNVYTNGLGDGNEGFQDTPASPGSVALFRFNQDSDLDGYSDRSEERLGTDPTDPADIPQPELLAGVYSTPRTGDHVVATLSLLNTGLYDAYGVEAVMIAPNDTITITNNTVGGSGRVRAQNQVIVGSRILPQSPLPAPWTQAGHAKPAPGGYFTGTADRTYTFTVQCSNPGGCSVGSGTWTVGWYDDAGTWGSGLNFGSGYASPTLLDVGAFGVKLGLLSGTAANGESFTVEARTPRDTFQYDILQEPFTPPIVLVSYNDPQGNHRLVIPPAAMALTSPTADLMAYAGQMLPDPGVEIVTTEAFAPGANTTTLEVVNPTETILSDAHLFLEFVNISGTVVSEVDTTVASLPPGPTMAPVVWDTADFNPPYSPDEDYIVMAFWTDYQGNILDTGARPLSSFQEDPAPAFAMAVQDELWDFGTAQQGTLLKQQFALASVGYTDLLTHLSDTTGVTVAGPSLADLPPGDVGLYTVTLNTQSLPVGPFQETITVRTNDPGNASRTITIQGEITPMPADTQPGAMQRPLDWPATVTGTQGQWVEFTHTLGPEPQTLHPVKVYSQDYLSLKGVGKYATAFGQGTASYEMFGDGRDGDLLVSAGQTVAPNTVRTNLSASGTSATPSGSAGFSVGDRILVHQTQGTGSAGLWELNTIAAINSANYWTLTRPLSNVYTSDPVGQTCGGGYWGEYYSNRTLSGSPMFSRCDFPLNVNWGGGSPGGGIPNDSFSVRWTGQFYFFSANNYQIDTCSDDGYRLYIDGQMTINRWQDQDGCFSDSRYVSAGVHTLAIEYYENGGNARFSIQIGASIKAQVIKIPQFRNVTVQNGGNLTATSWDGNTGGVLAVMCNGTSNLAGVVSATGYGFRGASRPDNYARATGKKGESYTGTYNALANSSAANFSGGGGAYNNNADAGSGGGGGGYATAGGNGVLGHSTNGSGPGQGGAVVGDQNLNTVVFFGGGGGSGSNSYTSGAGVDFGGSGGAGGGLVFLSGRQMTISGLVTANGANGTDATGHATGGGGGGAGGPILLRAQTASLGSSSVRATGGVGGLGGAFSILGGAGGLGRIRVDYCETVSGSTNPPASSQKLDCYIIEQVESTPHTSARLNLPESGSHTYQVQYGRRLVFGTTGEKTSSLRSPAGILASASLDALISGVGTGSLTLRLDVGHNGSWDWEYTGNITDAATLNNPNLAAAFNAYWANQGAPTNGNLDVPVKVYLSKAGQVLLTNLQVTPTGSKLRYIRLPAQNYSSVTVDLTVGQSGSGDLTMAADVGDDGTIDWTWSGSATYPKALTTSNLATAMSAYLQGQTGNVDVPIRFYVSPFLDLSLQDVAATPSAQPDLSIGASDIAFSAVTPTEGDEVTVTATLHNLGARDSGPLTASFLATLPGGGEWYIGSAFVPSVSAGSPGTAAIPWNTLGFNDSVPVRVVVDPFNRVAETNENNNLATASLTILTRPDLRFDSLDVSDAEPVVGESVNIALLLRNAGQATAGANTVTLYDGNPAAGAGQIGSASVPAIPGGGTTTVPFSWTPGAPGRYRLYARADQEGAVNEGDESNNDTWRDIYVGFAGPLLLDSGSGASDPPYTPASGYGVVDEGLPDEISNCSGNTAPEDTLRRDSDGRVVYRFDHLLPGHFYHLDVTLRQCDNIPRHESVYVDNGLVEGPITLNDTQARFLSTLLDPALYANRTISVTIESEGGDGALVGEVNLYDIDYRYADAGGGQDPQYPGSQGFGWLEGVSNLTWGSLPYQSARINSAGSQLRYRFDGLQPGRRYAVNLTFYQSSGAGRQQRVEIDGQATGLVVNTGDYTVHRERVFVPGPTYIPPDGSIVVGVVRTDGGTTGAMVNEISLEELTVRTPDIALSPTSVTASQPQGLLGSQPLTVDNIGTANLTWTIAEAPSDCASPGNVAWLGISPVSGTTAAGGNSPLTISLDSRSLSPAIYNAKLCISSNDPDQPVVSVPVQLTVTPATNVPRLSIPTNVPGTPYQIVTMPVQFVRNGTNIASLVFSVDYDQTCLQFDPTDSDGDGVPDAVTFSIPNGFRASVTFDAADTDGELDFFIGDTFLPFSALPDGTPASIQFRVICQSSPGNLIIARVGFSTDPLASFGDTNGNSVPGVTSDGSVEIQSARPGDCNADTRVDAGDISAVVLEIFDGDGNVPAAAPGGSFPGSPVGCNPNQDATIDAGDISCTVLLIFNGPNACGGSLNLEGPEAASEAPALSLLEPKIDGDRMIVPIGFSPGRHKISSLVFALDHDPVVAGIDPTDADGNGIPDAVALNLPPGFQAAVTVDAETGHLQIMIADISAPLAALPEQVFAQVTWQVKGGVVETANLRFVKSIQASFGDLNGRSVPGS